LFGLGGEADSSFPLRFPNGLATYIAHLNKPIRSLNELYRQYRDKFPSGGEVDNQIVASNPYNHQIAWIAASQDSVDVAARNAPLRQCSFRRR
jgi:hypothetical protein